MNKTKAACLFGLIVALAGCGASEPTENEITQVLKTQVEELNKQMAKSMGSSEVLKNMNMAVTFNSAKKIACTDAGSGKFNCTVEVATTAPFVGQQKAVKPLSFVKDGSEWKLVL